MDGQQWITQTFSVIDPGKDIDILVLVPAQAMIPNAVSELKASSDGVGLGVDCSFLGFPYGGGWKAEFSAGEQHFWYFPYLKHCTISGELKGDTMVWVLDGINNAGFSGGPVLIRTGSEQQVFAVISGYYMEPADVVELPALPTPTGLPQAPPASPNEHSKAHGKEVVNVNSGFITAFDIQSAIDAIRKNPIGPLKSLK